MRLRQIGGGAIGELWNGRWRQRGHVPFTNWNLVWKNLEKQGKSILDIGCGKGRPMRFLSRHGSFFTVGVDGFSPDLKRCQGESSHSTLILGDARALPFKENSFDIALCLQVLEHFEKEEGQLLLSQMERIARRQVVVTTDVGNHRRSPGADGNLLQEHKYVWNIDELKESGFRVFGMGLMGWGGETGASRLIPTPLRWWLSVSLQVLLGPFMYFFPRFAGAALCIKDTSRQTMR